MRSNRSYAMAGFIEHTSYGLVFLGLLVFLGVPFAGQDSTAWWLAFIIYLMTVGAVMYLSMSLAAYGKSMIFGTTFDVDIGEMHDIYNNAKVFKIIFMLLPLAVIGAVLSPIAVIAMLFNIKTFFKTEQSYLDQIDDEWESAEGRWNHETAEMDEKARAKLEKRQEEAKFEKQRLKEEAELRREEESQLNEEKAKAEKQRQKEESELRKQEESKQKKESQSARFTLNHKGSSYVAWDDYSSLEEAIEATKSSKHKDKIVKIKEDKVFGGYKGYYKNGRELRGESF